LKLPTCFSIGLLGRKLCGTPADCECFTAHFATGPVSLAVIFQTGFLPFVRAVVYLLVLSVCVVGQVMLAAACRSNFLCCLNSLRLMLALMFITQLQNAGVMRARSRLVAAAF
jgi:hypothetical protein